MYYHDFTTAELTRDLTRAKSNRITALGYRNDALAFSLGRTIEGIQAELERRRVEQARRR